MSNIFADDSTILVCLRIEQSEPRVHSAVDHCCLCGNAVWRALSAPATDHVICMKCVPPNAQFAPLTSEQIRDIMEADHG